MIVNSCSNALSTIFLWGTSIWHTLQPLQLWRNCKFSSCAPLERDWQTTIPRTCIPYSLWIVCGFFNIPCKCCETESMFYCPYLRRLESLTICRCHYKGNTLSSVIWRPWVLVWQAFEPTSFQTVVWCSTNWANRSQTKRDLKFIKFWDV